MTQKIPQAAGLKKTAVKRQRYLNLVYFFDSQKTRSFRFSSNTMWLAISSAVLMSVWSVLSVFIILALKIDLRKKQVDLTSFAQTVFDYQTKYDKVFETAYPAYKAKEEASEIATAGPPNKETVSANAKQEFSTAANGAETHAPSAEGSVSLAAQEFPPASKTKSNRVEPQTLSSTGDPTLALDTVVVKRADSAVLVNFALKNANPTAKAEGYIWGVARFVDVEQKISYVPFPARLPVVDQGIVPDPARSNRFSIKNLKFVDMDFKKPAGKTGTFDQITVGVLQQEGGKIEKVITVPQN